MNVTELLEAKEITLSFIRTAYLDVYPDGLGGLDLELVEPDKNDYWFYTTEYNDSCHCHPEMTRHSFTLPKDIADSMNRETITAFLRKRRNEYEAKEKKRLEEEAEKKRKYNEEQERKTFERLQKKYGTA
jgi:hypothetical protein